ncbi:uncharacterized protein [Henckelia pumila]|uniref:uncharacterized protein n=1 Tax=Henckelia pumila TaxID=405737 RepID=UPI003C6E87FE
MVAKAAIMEDLHALQQQFEAFSKMYQEDRLANARRHSEIITKLEELSQNISTMRTDAGPGDYGDKRSRIRHDDGYSHVPRCELFFRLQRTPEEDKVWMAALELQSKHQIWFTKLKRDQPNLTWEDFKYRFRLRFGPLEHNKLGELSKLSQDGTVDDYIRRFETLAVRAGPLSDEQEVEIFISGLKKSIAAELELHRPKDLASAMNLAQLYE